MKKKFNNNLKLQNILRSNNDIKLFKSLDFFPKIGNQNQKDFISINSLKNSSNFEKCNQNITDNKSVLEEELLKEIKLLWNELGIKDEYQYEFESYISLLNNSERKIKYLSFEKDNLTKFKNSLIKYMKEKEYRNKKIKLLEEINNSLFINQIEEKTIDRELIKEIINYIKSIRISSINVVNYFIKIRENFSLNLRENNIDFNIIKKNFNFDNNYLLKINSDLQFLKISEINKIFQINKEENFDTFLTKYINLKNNEYKSNINISPEILNSIDKCRYYILQEGILNNLKTLPVSNIPENFKRKKIYKISKNNSKNKKYKDYYKTNPDFRLFKMKIKFGNDYENLFFNSFKQIKIPKNSNRNMSRSIICQPRNRYIEIERENFKDDTSYKKFLEKKFLDNAINNIKSKEKDFEINNLYLENNKEDHTNKYILVDDNSIKNDINNKISKDKENKIIINDNKNEVNKNDNNLEISQELNDKYIHY